MIKVANYEPGSVIFYEDDPGDNFYIVLKGKVDVAMAKKEENLDNNEDLPLWVKEVSR